MTTPTSGLERPPNVIVVTLAAFSGGVALGMLSGAALGFWLAGMPVYGLGMFAAAMAPVIANARRMARGAAPLPSADAAVIFRGTLIGSIWGGLAGAFTVATCPGAHDFPFGPCAAGSVAMLMATFLAMVEAEEGLPPALSRRNPNAIAGTLYVLTVALSLVFGAEVPSWS